MACQNYANKAGMMHESKGQHIGKDPSLHLFHTPVTLRQHFKCMLLLPQNLNSTDSLIVVLSMYIKMSHIICQLKPDEGSATISALQLPLCS